MSLDTLKRRNTLDKLLSQVQQSAPQEKKSYRRRLWKPELDKSGNGYAVIRFCLHRKVRNSWVKIWKHASASTGKWYIENSLTTLNGQKDPVSDTIPHFGILV